VAAPVQLALVWHLHQPSYRDPATGRFVLPWTRLHATKDYGDMAAALEAHPGVHVTFSITPILLDQLDAISAGTTAADDPHLAIARTAPEALDRAQREFLLREFFHVQRARMLDPCPRYRELARRAEAERRGETPLTAQEVRDLQVWFHLAWVDPTYRAVEPIRSLWEQGRGFSEEQKGALLDWGIALAGRIAPAYRAARERGQVELATVPYHHPILPLLCDTDAPRELSATIPLPSPRSLAPEDAVAQVRAARKAHQSRFGAPPAGVWPAEGAVSQEAIAILEREGFRWAASDEETLRRALAAAGDPRADDPAARLQAWAVETGSGAAQPISMLFRDRRLSDLIGFSYMHAEPRAAAADFVARVRESAAAWRGEGPPIVAVILDGENCWESYEEDGGPFLQALYGALGKAEGIRAVTVSEALDAAPPRNRLTHVPVGSWIRADLGIWVGHAEKNRGWTELHHAREAIRSAEARGVAPERIAAAREALYAAEASDWFWWYGDDHPTEYGAEFDAGFRDKLRGAYAAAGLAAPSVLDEPIRKTPVRGATRPSGPVHARIDGRVGDYFEWRTAGHVACVYGAMHAAVRFAREMFFGTDGSAIFVRLDPFEPGSLDGTTLVVRRPAQEPVALQCPAGASAGDLITALDRVCELSIPFARLAEPGMAARFAIEIRDGDGATQRIPSDGFVELARPEEDPSRFDWFV